MYTEKRSKTAMALTVLCLCAFGAALFIYSEQLQSSEAAMPFVRTANAQTAKQNGISYAEYDINKYKPAVMNRLLTELRATGANWVALVVTQYQYDQNATVIYPTVKTATDDDLLYAIDRAHQLGLNVTLKPHVDIESDSSLWRGVIGQNFNNTQWTVWFSGYRTFINHYARLAQGAGAEQLVVGTELRGTSQREDEWRSVVSGVRSLYPDGLLTYSANHSGEEVSVNWWDALDYIGISAYYPLATNGTASLNELESGWQTVVDTLDDLASSTGKSIIFTEVGFRSTDSATTQPWCSNCSGPVDLTEQANAYQAFYNVIYDQTWLAGMYWWGWDVDPANSGPCNQDYSPFNKPAENVIRQAHGASSKTIPTDCNNIAPTATPITVDATATPSAPPTNADAGFVLVDNFDAANSGLLGGQNEWATLGRGTVADDPLSAGNQVIRLQGENAIAHRTFPFTISYDSTATIHYRLLRDGAVDSGMGATEETFPITFDAFEPQFGVSLNQVDAFYARDASTFKTLDATFAEDNWFCVWIVADVANAQSTIYLKGGEFADVTQLNAAGQSEFQFRNGTADLLRTFYTRTGYDGGGAIYLDDIYIDTASQNLTSPVAGCQSPDATPTPVDTATPQPANTATIQPANTATIQPTNTATIQSADTATIQPTNTATIQPTNTATVQPADTATIQPANTATIQPTNTATIQPTNTATIQPTNTATVRPANTATPQSFATATPQPGDTATPQPANTAITRPTNSAEPTPNGSSILKDLYIPIIEN